MSQKYGSVVITCYWYWPLDFEAAATSDNDGLRGRFFPGGIAVDGLTDSR